MTHAILQTIHSETQDKIAIIIMRRFNYLVRHSNKNVILTGDTEWWGLCFCMLFSWFSEVSTLLAMSIIEWDVQFQACLVKA